MLSRSEVFVCFRTMEMKCEGKLSVVLCVLMALLCHEVNLKI